MKEIKNAKIESTMFGFEDHGILTAFLHLNYSGAGQGFGGYDLRQDGAAQKWMAKVLKVVGVQKWEDLRGEHIRVESDHSKVYRIGNLLEDKWFNPATDL
jgi:hypothetical protein